MSIAQSVLKKITHIARPFNWHARGVLGIKLHGFGVQIFHFGVGDGMVRDGHDILELLIIEPLANDIGRKSLRTHFVGVSAALMEAVQRGQLAGADAAITLPHYLFDVRLLRLPWFSAEDLAIDASLPGFWEEYDPSLTQLGDRVVRFQIVHANENEDNCLVLFASIAESDVTRYKSLILDSDLLPISIENEFFAVLNGITANFDSNAHRAEQFVLHLCPGGNMLAGFTQAQFDIEPIAISELDEGLLRELAVIDEVEHEFWSELGARLSAQIKTALNILLTRSQLSAPESLLFVCEYPKLANYLKLLNTYLDDIRLVPHNGLETLTLSPKQEASLQKFANPSLMTSMRGTEAMGLYTPIADITSSQTSKIIDLNFLSEFELIKKNRQLAICQKLLIIACLIVGGISGAWIGFGAMPKWLATRSVSAEYDQKYAQVSVEAKRKKANKKQLDTLTTANNKLIKVVSPRPYAMFFEQLPLLVPPDIELKTLHLSEEGKLEMVGLARDNAALSALASAFVKNNFTPAPPQTKFARKGEFINFTLSATLQHAR